MGLVVAVLVGGGGAGAWLLAEQKPPLVGVPALVGGTPAQASARLSREHLRLAVAGRSYSPTFAAGRIVSQTPAGGQLREDQIVAVIVSLGPRPVQVPPLAGLTQAEATKLLGGLGLKVGTVTTTTSITAATGSVISSSPSSGTLLPGRPVDLVVSSGKPDVTVPRLSGTAVLSYQGAAAALSAGGFVPSEAQQYSNTVRAGEVIITSPAPGQSVIYGSAVSVEISLGPHLVMIPTSVVGMSVVSADATLSNLGFVVSGVTGDPRATVKATSPAVGTEALYGSPVQLITK